MTIETAFFQRDSPRVAQDLIGARLVHEDGDRLSGRIVETEAYLGEDDPASHASDGKTSRNDVMFGPAGRSYVYICYGIHTMFNIVTGEEGTPSAVLIRAIEPQEGIETMQERRDVTDRTSLCDGPGKVCEALGIDNGHNDIDITEGNLQIERGDSGTVIKDTRIGVTGGEDLQYRFYEEGNDHVSRH